MPSWLHNLAIVSLITAGICAVIIAIDIFTKHPQNMWIMSLVWPLTALWSGPLGLYAYYKVGRLSSKKRVQRAKERGEKPPNKKKPFWQSVGVGATHCGSGCTLADICAEWFAFFVPVVVFGSHILGTWVVDYIVALIFGIAFQYFTIKPMRGLSVVDGLKAAVKADILSLTAWQVGMYGWMAIAFLMQSLQRREPPQRAASLLFVILTRNFTTDYPCILVDDANWHGFWFPH